MKKWIKINGYKINVTKLVAIFPIRDLGEEFGIEVYFVGGNSLVIPMPTKEEAIKAHSHLSLLVR